MTSMKKLSDISSLDGSEMLLAEGRSSGTLLRWFIAGTLLNLCLAAAMVGLTVFYVHTELESVRSNVVAHENRLTLLEKVILQGGNGEDEDPAWKNVLLRKRRAEAFPLDYAFDGKRTTNSSGLVQPRYLHAESRPEMTKPCRDGRDGRDGSDGRDGRAGAPGPAGEMGSPGVVGPQGVIGLPGPKGGPGEISDTIRSKSSGGPTYIRWGRTTCPDRDGTELVYRGFGSGALSGHKGGTSDFFCIPTEPQWAARYNDAANSNSYLYGMEYEVASFDPFSHENAEFINQRDVPCAVCRLTDRGTHLLMPAKTECPGNWTEEYTGFLMSGLYSTEQRSQAVCVDEAPEVIPGSQASSNAALLYIMETQCGSIPCPPYVANRELTCTVCSI